MILLRIIGWAMTAVGSFAILLGLPGQISFNCGVVLVLFSLMVVQDRQDRQNRRIAALLFSLMIVRDRQNRRAP